MLLYKPLISDANISQYFTVSRPKLGEMCKLRHIVTDFSKIVYKKYPKVHLPNKFIISDERAKMVQKSQL